MTLPNRKSPTMAQSYTSQANNRDARLSSIKGPQTYLALSTFIVSLATIIIFVPGLSEFLQSLVGGESNLLPIRSSGIFLTVLLWFWIIFGSCNSYHQPDQPIFKQNHSKDVQALHFDKILEEEFEYAASTAEQAMEHQKSIINLYLLIAGVIALIVVGLAGLGNTKLLIGGAILLGIVITIGCLTLLKFIAIRRAWGDSTMAMNAIKEFYIINASHHDSDDLRQAFVWNAKTVAPLYQRGDAHFFSAMLLALFDAIALLGGSFLLGWSQSADLSQTILVIVLLSMAVLFFLAHIWTYNIMLTPSSSTKIVTAKESEAVSYKLPQSLSVQQSITNQNARFGIIKSAQPNTVINSKIEFAGRIFTVRHNDIRQPDGTLSYRDVVEHRPVVVILPYLEDTDEIIFIEQYRDAVSSALIELPAGMIADKEDHAVTAKRELREETGHIAGKMLYLGRFYTSPGFVNECLYLYLATQLTRVSGVQDTREIFDIHKISRAEAMTFIENGTLLDGKSILGLFWSQSYLPTKEAIS